MRTRFKRPGGATPSISVCLLIWIGCIADVGASSRASELTAAQMLEDLRYVRDVWAARERSLDVNERRAFERVIAEAAEQVNSLTAADFALEVSRAVAVAQNMHSRSTLGPYFRGIPLEAAWFADGLYVVRAHPKHASLLGARILSFGPLPTEEALARVTPFISGIDSHVRSSSPDYLRLFEVLERIGATHRHGEVELRVLRGGNERVVKLSAADAADTDMPSPAIVFDSGSSWRHVLEFAAEVPAIYRHQQEEVSADWLAGVDRALHVICTDLRVDSKGASISRKLADIVVNEVLERRPRDVIVDLRINAGGNVMNGFLFSYVLPRLLPREGKVYVLIGPRTLSAAIATVAMLKARGKDRVVLVGEPVGDRPQFWADSEQLVLPQSKLEIMASREYADWENGCDDLNRCLWLNVALGESNINLEPEIRVQSTYEDYAEGRDPVLDAVVDRLRR